MLNKWTSQQKYSISTWFYILLLTAGYVLLYFNLKDVVLFTPDFAGSDAANNLPAKYFMQNYLRSGIFPLWSRLLEGGYPILAESQLGLLYLPYYIAFPFFPSLSSFTTSLFIFHLVLLNIGMYLLLRYWKTPPFLSFLLSIIFTWNGAITFRWVHFIVLQSFAYTPLLFLTYFHWNETLKLRYLILLSLIISLMVFAGFVQCVFMALLGLVLVYCIQNQPLSIKKTSVFLCSLLFGIFLSLPQIIPTLKLSQYTTRSLLSTYSYAVSVPFKTSDLCGFFSPICLGSAKNATYSTDWQKNGIYWENTPYVGELFVILILTASVYYVLKSKKVKSVGIFLIPVVFFVLLALGKFSPLYFLFSIPPFSLFRTPGRYLLFVVFFLVLYSSKVLIQITQKRGLLSLIAHCLLIVNCIILIRTAFLYHLFIPAPALYKSLSAQKIVKPGEIYLTYGGAETWNRIFLKDGWSKNSNQEQYLFLTSALMPNMNLYSGQASFSSYLSLRMRRQSFLNSFFSDNIYSASKSAQMASLLQLYNITSIISFKPISIPNFKKVQVLKNANLEMGTYQVNRKQPEYYVPKVVLKVSNLEEIKNLLNDNKMTTTNSLAESISSTISQNESLVDVSLTANSDFLLKGDVKTDKKTFIVLRRNWYPEWRLLIDGKKQTIYKTNLIHMGFYVPAGSHNIQLEYVPSSLYIGFGIAIFSGALFACIILISKKNRDLF